jgi:hypothetical protein
MHFSKCPARVLKGLAFEITDLNLIQVTGAKVRALVDFLLAPTRGDSIQPVCECPIEDI